jgi:phage terminase small subunit
MGKKLTEGAADEEFGPAMLALDERQRRFCLGYFAAGGKKAAAVARRAGYSRAKGAAAVRAHRLLQSDKILAALRELSERSLSALGVQAVARLDLNLRNRDAKVGQVAADSVLDRIGMGRRSSHKVDIEITDNRSTAELLEEVDRLRGNRAVPVIEAKARG